MAYTGYARVELMGHRVRLGLVSEEEVFGGKFLRLDIPFKSGVVTEFYGPTSIYAITPISEEICLKQIGDQDPRPVRPLEYRIEDQQQDASADPITAFDDVEEGPF